MSAKPQPGDYVWRGERDRIADANRYEIEADGERVARQALHLEGAAAARSVQAEARLRELALLALREDPLRRLAGVTWPRLVMVETRRRNGTRKQ
jgi:hypothetical protein